MAKPAVQTFGKYQILERIATGGMAEIYKARLEGIGGFQRTFAIKRILPHLSQNAEYVAMLVDEAKVAGLLSHANIVQILDLGQVNGVWYIAMEYVQGRDLGAVLKRAAMKGLSLPVPHAVFIALELLKGLEYAHQRQVMRGGRPVPLNIIHRDVSPPNVLLSFQGEVKLTDFGIARASHKALETQSGVIKGRFDYMSAEQAEASRDLDQRSDLFSVGVVLYEMITGRHPFRAETELSTLERIRTGRYPPVSQVNASVPFQLETIIDRALRPDRSERYPTATAFKEGLDKFFHEAGFIFTHSTLATYVRGLFPDAASATATSPPAPRFLGDEEPPLPDDLDLEFDADVPTRMIDKAAVSRSEESTSSSHRFGLKSTEDPTLVRRNPLLVAETEAEPGPASDWGDEQETVIKANPLTPLPFPPQVRLSAVAADEQETLIKASPFGMDPLRLETPEPSTTLDGQNTSDISLSMPIAHEETEPPVPPRQEIAPVPSAARRPAIGWLGAVLALVLGVVGLGSGVLGGLALALVLGVGQGSVAAEIPVLQIRAPTGATVTVDGVAVATSSDIPVTVGAHTVVITPAAGTPLKIAVDARPGQVHTVLVTGSAGTAKGTPE